jgi:type I restriction enzyme, S subunit
MTDSWPIVTFGEILRPNLRPYELGPEEDANLVGMRWYGEGPFHRELKAALTIGKKSHFVIRSGDVMYNKLFAWKGAFGIVPEALDKMFVSDKFPTYVMNTERILPDFLKWYFRCPPLWEQARVMSTGSAALSKFTLNPPKFLHLTIPLPPLGEQRRMVATIDKVASLCFEASRLRAEAKGQAEALFFAGCEDVLHDLERRTSCIPLGELVDQKRGISYGIVQTGSNVDDGVPTLRAGDLGWFTCRSKDIKQVAPEIEQAYERTRLRGGELLLRIRGGVGEVAVCSKELIGANVSREIAVIPLDKTIIPEYAMYLMAAPTVQKRMAGHVRGTSYIGINLRMSVRSGCRFRP